MPFTHKVLGEPPPAARLRRNRVSLLSFCGRGGTTKRGSTWGPGLTPWWAWGHGLRWPGQSCGPHCQEEGKSLWKLLFLSTQSCGSAGDRFSSHTRLAAEVAISSGKDRQALRGREVKQFCWHPDYGWPVWHRSAPCGSNPSQGEDPIRDADTPNTFCPQCSLQSPSEQGLAQRLRQAPVVRTLSFPPSFRSAENHGESYFRPVCNYAVKSRIKRH